MMGKKNLLKKENIPNKLFGQVDFLGKIIKENVDDKKVKSTFIHLTKKEHAYKYIYYTMLVKEFLKNSKGLIVDWGGFVGQVTMLLNSLGYNCENYVLKYPSIKDILDEHQKDLNIKFKKNEGDVKTLSYNDSSCRAVISSGVLEHVYEHNIDEEVYLKEFNRILEPGGYLFIWNLPRKLSLLENVCKLRGLDAHEKTYYDFEVKKMLKDNGFDIVYWDVHDDILTLLKPVREKMIKKDIWNWLYWEYKISKLPVINLVAHHITVVCRKRV